MKNQACVYHDHPQALQKAHLTMNQHDIRLLDLPNQCGNGQLALPGYFCGRDSNHLDYLSNSTCVIAPNDAHAVYYPSNDQSVTESMTKPPTPDSFLP
ncbi:unnamed protein product [Rotaria sp. Silwood1]|nr:unnamed protein product [Rotaria sp. Silwood1]